MKIQTKKQIRNHIKQIKEKLTQAEILQKSRKIENLLFELEEYKEAKNIFIYINFNQEVITTEIIKRSLEAGKKVFVPKVYNDIMMFHRIDSVNNNLVRSAHGILEPLNCVIEDTREGLLIMPGLAYDKEFNRIGYGGGYYDKYLSLPNFHIKLALAFSFQIFDSIYSNEFDMKVDIIVTENEVLNSKTVI